MKTAFSLGILLLLAGAPLGLGLPACDRELSSVASETHTQGASVAAPRPYEVRVPKGYGDAAVPLVLALHPLGGAGARFVQWWGLDTLADEKGFLLVAPDGTSLRGERFWNATDGCCDFGHSGVDDVAYLTSILDDVTARYHVDPKRIYVVGFSNGAFMAHRMACEDSARIAAIVTLAGAAWKDATKCKAASRVSVVEAHGTADAIVGYGGGGPIRRGGGTFPSATQTAATWAKLDGCKGPLSATGDSRHFVATLPPGETHVSRYAGCPSGSDVELWTIDGAPHIPELLPSWGDAVWAFLAAHPKT